MAVAFDNSTASEFNNSLRSSHTFSHTCTGSDLVLLVGVGSFNSTGGTKVSGITYGGVSMNLVGTLEIQENTYIDLYKLVGPSTGANNVVISYSTSQSFGWNTATSYTGAGDPDVVKVEKALSSASPTTISLTTLTDNSWLAMYAFCNNTNVGPSTGTTERSDATRAAAMDSNGAKTPAGSYSLSYTHPATAATGAIMVAIPPAAGGGGGTPYRAKQNFPRL